MFKLFGRKKIEQKTIDILNDTLSIEMIAKIASDMGTYFEIVRPSDGVIFRFYKNENDVAKQGYINW